MAELKIPDDATLTPAREDIISGEYSESTYCWTKYSGIAAAAASDTIKICIIGKKVNFLYKIFITAYTRTIIAYLLCL